MVCDGVWSIGMNRRVTCVFYVWFDSFSTKQEICGFVVFHICHPENKSSASTVSARFC